MCAFTKYISRINNTQLDDIDIIMPMYNLIEYSDNYSKTSEILWWYCKNEPAINHADGKIADFTEDNVTDSFKMKEKITGKTDGNGTKNVEIMIPLKYLSNF